MPRSSQATAVNLALVDEAHARPRRRTQNDVEQFAAIAAAYDFAVNEECVQFDDFGRYTNLFINRDDAVFHIEYVPANQVDEFCAVSAPLVLSTLVKNLLDDPFTLCP